MIRTDENDDSQVAAQKKDELLRKIEVSATLNQKLKDKFRAECELALDKDNPIAKFLELELALRRYEEFVLGMKTNFLYERDGFISGDIDGFSLWGGGQVNFGNETLTSEALKEKMFWLREFVEPLYENEHNLQKIDVSDLEARRQTMQARMGEIKLEAGRRKKQIFEFQKIRQSQGTLAQQYKKLFSLKLFKKATFEERRNILLRITDEVRKIDSENAWPQVQKKNFELEMRGKLAQAGKLSPSDAWEFYQAEYMKLRNRPKQLKGVDFLRSWCEYFKGLRKGCEEKIAKKIEEVKRDIAKDSTTVGTLKKDLDYISQISPQLKLETKLGTNITDLELQLLEKINNPEGEKEEKVTSIRESLLMAQQENEFIRRIFIQIAALAMAMGSTSTASESQKQLVKGDLEEKSKIGFKKEDQVKQAASQKTARNLEGGDAPQGVDALSAIQDKQAIQVQKGEGGLRAGIEESAQAKHKTDSWEMTRLIGINVWPPQQLENYLRKVKHTGHHLELTHNYLPVSFLYAATLLKQRIAANLQELPGKTAQRKKAYQGDFFNLIDGAQKIDDNFVERIFSYTPNL